MITDLTQLLDQEKQLQFTHFDNESAWQLGSLIKRNAEKIDAKVAIDITLNSHRLFSYAMPSTSIDNQEWIKRKQNVVQRYQHSSWYMGQYYKAKGKSIEEASFVNGKDYTPFGGSFPLSIQGVGVIVSITVSGLPQYEDHLLLVDSIGEFIENQKSEHSL